MLDSAGDSRFSFLTPAKPQWDREGRDWPNRGASRFVHANDIRWHVQVMGSGPTLLLLHGAGAATHSWRGLAPLLARDFSIVAPDLPGHGFTDTPGGDGLALEGMVRAVSALLTAMDRRPELVVGHSAGAAIALRMALEGRIGPSGVVSLNGALQPFPGAAGFIFPAMARLLFVNPLAIQWFAWRAGRPNVVERLMESTGSRIDAAGLSHYEALLRKPGHIAGALGMMANWELNGLMADVSRLASPLTLVVGLDDRAVPPRVAYAVKAQVPHSSVISLPGLGHLAHEEAPERIAEIVREAARGR